MGKEQELLEAARTGNVAVVEKLLSGKRGILGSGSGSIPLPNLLSMWKGLNVNCTDSSGYTPLHHAALNGHREVVLKLLQFEASTNVADSKGCFPLHLAAWRGDVDIVRILIHHRPSHCLVNQQNLERDTALHCAAQYGHSEVVSVLLQELTDPTMRNSRHETPLDLAALYGRLQVVCMLVSAHPNLMSVHGRQHTPLHLAARNGHHSTVVTLLEAGMDVNCVTENGSALHEATLFGKTDVVRLLLDSGIDTNLRDSQRRTALEILREHPAPKSQQITALIQEYVTDEMERRSIVEEPVRKCPIPAPRASISSPSASPSLKHKNDAVTSELSKLLHEIKKCRDRDYSFEELCHTISSHSMDSFGSGRLSDDERLDAAPNGTLTRVTETPPFQEEEDESDRSCGPAGFWEALTPCNGCHNLGFSNLSQDAKRSAEVVASPSLDVFLPDDEDNPYESVTTAVTRKPCSLDISHACPRNGHLSHGAGAHEGEHGNHGNHSTGPTPDCSPPSPDTALKNIERVIRPQPKQRTSLSSSLDVQRTVNHSCEPSEVSSSLGYASFSTSPPASPPFSPNQDQDQDQDSAGSNDDCPLADDAPYPHVSPNAAIDDRRKSRVPEEFVGLLHGSSPACETPDTPYHLYSPKPNKHLQAPEFSNVITGAPSSSSSSTTQRTSASPQKPRVVYRTVFHTRVNQDQTRPGPVDCFTLAGSFPSGANGELPQCGGNVPKGGASGPGYEERACTLGRMRSMPRSVLDLQLSKSLSKSDSNLVAVSPIQEENICCSGSRGQDSGGGGTISTGKLERTPSFTAEWEEIDKIMSSIGAGIGSGMDAKAVATGPRCPLQSVGQWLDSIGLVQYENHLLANGFDNVQFMGSNVVEDQDLLEIGILNSAHRQRLLQAIRLLPRVRPVGYDGNNPTSVAEWLESLELGDYTKSFLVNGYTSMELVKKIWEIELINVLKISLIGHRKRILASLGDRLLEDTPQKPPRAISLREPGGNHTPPQLSPAVCPAAYTAGIPGGSLDVQHLIMQADARRRQRSNDNYFDDVPRSKLERQMAQVSMAGEWCEPITLRPPNEATSSTPVQYWQHHPEKLIFQSCDYEAYYLGSMLVKELRGTESTHDACAKMRKSTEQMKKVPTIILSVSYKGVKFIDATNKNIIAEHEIRNISCAAQDPEDLSTFAYITKDLKSSHHYCHVFTAFDVNLAYEIILTLGQAFEVAYQLALQARKSGHGSSTLPESFDGKPGKPVPKPRVNIRKSMEQASMEQKGHANVPWIVEPAQEAKRGVNTKAVADAHVFYCGNQRM
ncbi:ankyrin repeat and sterile alpha motif domain-containing protein 1B isoform X1 [Entelurus aequoreus]|uniref:ankyrin repeat and sterile alpha motif domain-containing protein 1B isoform X1 n=2 Tax=Entelurus aequoreus TaxID=161455 RepID=UPI002B1D94A2|nr:ankyrin repeat and sterile alpha motif domain-containing protein 1B isoform X1 [Entelurus aequoreus]XP_061920786.1 ankyrin repeat and sterile alpha motif domain-containing protein 1B isoform X1 [Entelurus aequoreus]